MPVDADVLLSTFIIAICLWTRCIFLSIGDRVVTTRAGQVRGFHLDRA